MINQAQELNQLSPKKLLERLAMLHFDCGKSSEVLSPNYTIALGGNMLHRHILWNRGELDVHRMMTGDDTGGDVWTVAGAW